MIKGITIKRPRPSDPVTHKELVALLKDNNKRIGYQFGNLQNEIDNLSARIFRIENKLSPKKKEK